ncbi:hypothetical protein MYX07_02055 [Patescibacteria group bacterium AH-259-L07]|nr:hypothetical protein [Patescibacteria group bacterium AH-259-L07]
MATISMKEKEIKNFIRRTIIESIQDILTDTDYGMKLRKSIVQRLEKYSKRTPKKITSLDDIKKRYA